LEVKNRIVMAPLTTFMAHDWAPTSRMIEFYSARARGGAGLIIVEPASVVDLPPGTGDIQLSISQLVRVSAALVVSTPQELAFADVLRAAEFWGTGIDLHETGHLQHRVPIQIGPFTITPYLAVTSPNGGETWTGGTAQTVTWTSVNVADEVAERLEAELKRGQ
jgi:hypothetical protein